MVGWWGWWGGGVVGWWGLSDVGALLLLLLLLLLPLASSLPPGQASTRPSCRSRAASGPHTATPTARHAHDAGQGTPDAADSQHALLAVHQRFL